MLGVLTYAIAVIMTAVALWRLPALRYGDPHRRALWASTAGFAGALWCRAPGVKYAMDHSPITDLAALLKYLTSMVAILAVLNYMMVSYGRRIEGSATPRHIAISRKVTRVANTCAYTAIASMCVLFFTAVQRDHPSTDFAADHAGQWGAALFLTVFYIYLGSASATCFYQWGRAGLRAETWPLRIGLGLMAFSMSVYSIYAPFRIFFVWGPFDPDDSNARAVSDVVSLAVAVLFATGASIPSTKAAIARWNSWRTLYKLYPLRRDLLLAFPDFAFQRPASRLRELTRTSPPLDVRLDRWTQEIADAVDQLRHHATSDLLPMAEEVAEDHADPEPAAEALWIKAALQTASSGRRSPVPVRWLPEKPLADSQSEAHWLARVQATYATITSAQVRELLDAAGEPPAAAA
ncbi:MAB_1171c family putative transporter [Streptomyces decoyicus]|uniref:MAB_1171c family putative transporter n=1 Tax=Streptomyces decoyicus TaxID=249567 RepID=UPI003649F381